MALRLETIESVVEVANEALPMWETMYPTDQRVRWAVECARAVVAESRTRVKDAEHRIAIAKRALADARDAWAAGRYYLAASFAAEVAYHAAWAADAGDIHERATSLARDRAEIDDAMLRHHDANQDRRDAFFAAEIALEATVGPEARRDDSRLRRAAAARAEVAYYAALHAGVQRAQALSI